MTKLKQSLSLKTGKGESYDFNLTEDYNEVYHLKQVVNNNNSFITLLKAGDGVSNHSLQSIRALVIKNHGKVGAEIQLRTVEYVDNSDVDNANSIDLGPGSATVERNMSLLLGAGEYMFLPSSRLVNTADSSSAANAKPTTSGTYLTLDTNEYVDSGADADSATAAGVISSASATTLYLEPYTSATNCTANLFNVGDLIRIRDEVMEVTAIGDKSNLANNYLTVIRGVKGSTAGTAAADDDPIRLPFFNAYYDYDKYSVVQTDASGKFKSMNFFGFGRVQDKTSDGIVPGSISGKFYEAGYQNCGMTGITPQTSSGLAVSTAYAINLTVDGGSAFANLSFTTDSSNVNFGGTNGIIRKIQDALDTQYYTAGNLFEKKVHVGIVNGDLRLTSGQHLSTSMVAVTDPDSGTSPFSVGRFPDIGTDAEDVNAHVEAKLPPDTIVNEKGIEIPNTSVFFYDDGHGNIKGTATGTINYQTGVIDFTGPPNAQFVITANYDSAHGGGSNSTEQSANVITTIGARSCNSKINCPIELVAFD